MFGGYNNALFAGRFSGLRRICLKHEKVRHYFSQSTELASKFSGMNIRNNLHLEK